MIYVLLREKLYFQSKSSLTPNVNSTQLSKVKDFISLHKKDHTEYYRLNDNSVISIY